MSWRSALALVSLVCLTVSVRAEHARIDLRVQRLDPQTGAVEEESQAYADVDPPQGGLNPRPLLEVKANDPLVLQFVFTNTYPHGDIKKAEVEYFVVREEKPRQKEVPSLKEGAVTQGKFTLNFKPEGRAGARLVFTIKEPGVYLVRVQSANTQSDHEHFSAIDVRVK